MTDDQNPESVELSPVQPPQTTNIPRRKPVPATNRVSRVERTTTTTTTTGDEQTHELQSQSIASDPDKDLAVESQTVNSGSRRRWFILFAWCLAVIDRVRLGPLEKYLPSDQRKRRYVIAGIIAGTIIALLAIIIGVTVSVLTNSDQNLPLPTSHGGPYSGDLTYYGPALGACGITSSDSDSICAVSHIIFDAVQTGSNPNANPLCGLKMRLRRNEHSVDVTVVDRCVGCKATDIDTTTSVFGKLADIDQGRVNVEWAWLESSPVNVSSIA
ncbi:riboflavin aldehyde-forming enzyme [Talaromyces stipitatus ATCC 10500]|uniref:Riboflavin aldehyde-forming enzyme n=1 Tax=Talaromyces stipitatus (strain ATCC 10500 / CBS 375.48 / QM 6759 / NRRL 1006) TaxID=441959 RepID=B8MCF2_TALSN|nr:riboflavin aldehyde-forming enzyme [Talaromyces stipitatus ATCC 10500]EED18768.1 riboflavin aldehyde-forming enzyme [Talaromyces stipitatus ATCC 10500]